MDKVGLKLLENTLIILTKPLGSKCLTTIQVSKACVKWKLLSFKNAFGIEKLYKLGGITQWRR